MLLNTDHLARCILTLETSLARLKNAEPNSIDFEVFRNAVVKGFELVLETSGKLLRKALKAYVGGAKSVDELVFKDVLRHGSKHGLLSSEATERWLAYRDNRNSTAHDYGEIFATETLALLPTFISDARALEAVLRAKFGHDDGASSGQP